VKPKEFKAIRLNLNFTLKQFSYCIGKSNVMTWRYEKGLIKIPKHVENLLKSATVDKLIELSKSCS
jgi:transcriptional regulator with XRE-family HTH domain